MLSLVSSILVTSVVVTAVAGQTIVSSHGSSGVLCGLHRCLGGTPPAVCSNSQCVCPDDKPQGIGSFVCSSEDYEICMIFNDPQVVDFSSRRRSFPLNCKALGADLETTLCDEEGNLYDGTCGVKVLPFGRKIRGKTYVGGFEATVWGTAFGVTFHIKFRLRGVFDEQQYHYNLESTFDEGSNSSWGDVQSLNIDGVGTIEAVHDSINNFVGVVAKPCGVRVGIRVVNPDDRFLQIAGLFVEVDNKCAPQYLSLENALCASPDDSVDLVQDAVDFWSNQTGLDITREMIVFFNILTTPDIEPFEFPNAPPALVDLVVTAGACDSFDLITGLYWCLFVTDAPHLVRCLDPSEIGNELMVLLNQCLQIFCFADQTENCFNVQDQLTNCTQFLPEGDTINNYDC